MEGIRDPLWRRLLVSFRTAERFESSGCSWTVLAAPPGRERNERYRYVLLVFETPAVPVLLVALEADILGDWMATLLESGGRRTLARFDSEPAYETWRELAMQAAWERLAALRGADKTPSTRPERGGPRYPLNP
ncbi:MAG TPA: hypothetical protein PKW82_01005 [Spirochaetales bacterium]|nr:hypothetical protein [Spirochaetales bacterium]